MPRYDDSPGPLPPHPRDRGHSPLDRRGGNDTRRMKSSPMSNRRGPMRDQSPPPMSHQHHQQHRGGGGGGGMREQYDDYAPRGHQGMGRDMGGHGGGHSGRDGGGGSGGSIPYKILCVSNLNPKYSDNSIRDSLMREFHRFGEPSVKLVQDGNERLAYLYFRNYDDARDARHAKSRLLMYEKPVIIDPIYERAMQMPRRQRSMSPDYGPPPSSRGRMDRGMDRMDRPGPPPSPPMNRGGRGGMDRGGQMGQMRGGNMGGQEKMYMQPSHHRNDNYNNNNPRDNMPHNMSGRGGGGGDYHHHSGGGGSNSGGNHHNNNPGGGNNRQQQQHRDSKKEKFPNYLHHIAPEEDEKATRTLFIGNLEVTISDADLRRIFERYGVVEDIDVKRPPPGQGNAYAFIKFLNLDMAHRSKVEMSGQYIGKFQCKIGYGKATPTTRIWVGGLGPWTSLSHLEREFDRFGAIRKIDFVKGDNHAYIQYDSIDAATAAIQEMRGFPLGGPDKRLRVDFADPGPYNYAPYGSPSRSGSAAGVAQPPVDPGFVPPAGGQQRSRSNQPEGSENWPAGRFPPGGVDGLDFDGQPNARPRRSGGSNAGEFDDAIAKRGERFGSDAPGNVASIWDETVGNLLGDRSSPADRKRRRTPEGLDVLKRRRGSVSPSNGLPNDSSPRSGKRSPSFDRGMNNVLSSNGKGDLDLTGRTNFTLYESVTSIPELVKCCPSAWNGGLILKTSAFPSRMLYCSGDSSLVDLLMKDVTPIVSSDSPILRITQRLRLDPPKLEDVNRRMSASAGGYCMLLTTSVATNLSLSKELTEENDKIQQRPLKNLVTYLKSKDAAGVISLSGGVKDGKEVMGVLYAFPPCPYALELLRRVAPNLSGDTTLKEDYLLVVVVRGGNN